MTVFVDAMLAESSGSVVGSGSGDWSCLTVVSCREQWVAFIFFLKIVKMGEGKKPNGYLIKCRWLKPPHSCTCSLILQAPTEHLIRPGCCARLRRYIDNHTINTLKVYFWAAQLCQLGTNYKKLERGSLKESHPSHWPVGKSMVHPFNYWQMWEILAHDGQWPTLGRQC